MNTADQNTIPSHVIDYPARDMTITAGASLTIGELQRTLRAENQQLPIDVADELMPIGTMVENDIAGPRQFGYGTLRDYVIGIEAVDGSGRVFHAGGRVVKNVAGYDLCRLIVGSRGQLGRLRQVTFKVKPLPACTSLVAAGFRSLRDAESALERLNLTATTPVILDIVGRYAAPGLLQTSFPALSQSTECFDAVAVIIIGFDGPKVACDWQTNMVKDELLGTATWLHIANSENASSSFSQHVQRASTVSDDVPWLARLVTLPSRLVSAMTVLQDAGCDVFGRAGNGVLYVRPSTSSLASGRVVDESKAFTILHSLVADGVGSVEAMKSTVAQSTKAHPAVQELTQKLQTVLGATG